MEQYDPNMWNMVNTYSKLRDQNGLGNDKCFKVVQYSQMYGKSSNSAQVGQI